MSDINDIETSMAQYQARGGEQGHNFLQLSGRAFAVQQLLVRRLGGRVSMGAKQSVWARRQRESASLIRAEIARLFYR